MAERKWRSAEYVKVLQIYRNYEILYNVRHCNYTNKPLKVAAFNQFLKEVNDAGKLTLSLPRCLRQILPPRPRCLKDVIESLVVPRVP